jgi:uridine kinase
VTDPSLTDIEHRIRATKSPQKTKIIGIDGCGGAGKSTLAARLAAKLNAQIIHTDDFASWHNAMNWHDRLMTQVIAPLTQNVTGRYQRYDWSKETLAEWHDVPVQAHVIIEGVSCLHTFFRTAYAFAIYIEAPRDIRLKRGLARDGQDALPLWKKWQKDEDIYVILQSPQTYADIILNGTHPIPD